MKRIQTKQSLEIDWINLDLIIVSSGYEDRCTFFSQTHIDKFENAKKVCLAFDNSKENNFFKESGFEILSCDGENNKPLEIFLKSFTTDKNDNLNILIDYSSMTRIWYSTLLCFFANNNSDNINIQFVYSFSKYIAPPRTTTRNIHVKPLEGFSTFSIPDKPTALIIGLGYEPEKAFGLSEFFDAETFLLYNDKSFGSEFSTAVEDINSKLINSVPSDNIYKYPIGNLIVTEKLLIDLCRGLNEKFRIVITPTGPKPFTLVSLICALKIKNVDIWRVSAGSMAKPINREANGKFSIYVVNFTKQN